MKLAGSLILILAILSGCDSYQLVSDSDYQVVEKARSGQYELVKKEELAQLRQDAQIGKSVGRYQIYANGLRTWRLDTSTGRTCIMSTTTEDWKDSNTSASGCLEENAATKGQWNPQAGRYESGTDHKVLVEGKDF